MNTIRVFVCSSLILLIIPFANSSVTQKSKDEPAGQASEQEPEFEEDESYDSSLGDEKALLLSDTENEDVELPKADIDDSELENEPIRSEEEYEKEHEIKQEKSQPSVDQETAPIQKPPSWDKFEQFEELYEETQRKQPFMIMKANPYGTYTTYFEAVLMKSMKLYKFYKKNIEGEKHFSQKIQNRISRLYEIQPDLDKDHLNDELLLDLYNKLHKKNVYDFVFYGASLKYPLKAVCPREGNKKIEIYFKKQTSVNLNQNEAVDQNEDPSLSSINADGITSEDQQRQSTLPNTVSPTSKNLPSDRDKSSSPKTLSPSQSWLGKLRVLSFRSESQNRPTQIVPDLENYEKVTYEGQVLRTHHTVNFLYYFWPSLHPCKKELEPAFIHHINRTSTLIYEVGYLVEFKNPPKRPVNLKGDMITPQNTIWYHLSYFVLNPQTKDTLYALHYIPFYEEVKEKIKNLAVYTDYEVNKGVYPEEMEFDYLYTEENQTAIFKEIAGENYKKYFNVSEDLVLEKQELIDQKTLPVMSYRRMTLYYMNIAPMYKIVRKHAWSKVEEAVLSIPIAGKDTDNKDKQTEVHDNTNANNTENEIRPEKQEDIVENNTGYAENEINFEKQEDRVRNITDYAKHKIESPADFEYEPVIRLVNGTYDELKVKTYDQKKEEYEPVYLYHEKRHGSPTKRLRVPYAFYKLIQVEYTSPKVKLFNIPCYLTHYFTIVIITHNDPFEEKPEPLCDEKISCKDYGWSNIDQENPKFGLTYCCKFTKTLIQKLGINDVTATIKSNRVLNLNTLKNIFKSKESYHKEEVAPEDQIPDPVKKEQEKEQE